jgi:branched-subunit amino acid aminotransferase/4-amino-4-deoxychorismate lyase
MIEFDRAAIEADTAALLAAVPGHDGCLRLVSTGAGTRLGFIEALPPIPPSITLTTLPYASTILLDGVKSLSYAANMLATRIAASRGASEALLVTEDGTVLEGPRQSFVASLDGERLITPPLSDRVLDSITRGVLLKTGLVEEESIAVDQIPQIKEAFLASTLREVHPVSAIDDHQIDAPGPLSAAVDAVLRATIAEAVGQPA